MPANDHTHDQDEIQVRLNVSASLKRIHFRRFGVGHLTRRRVRNTPVRWLLHTSKQS